MGISGLLGKEGTTGPDWLAHEGSWQAGEDLSLMLLADHEVCNHPLLRSFVDKQTGGHHARPGCCCNCEARAPCFAGLLKNFQG